MSERAPLRLHDGTLVHADGRIVSPNTPAVAVREVEIPTHSEARDLVLNARRKASDLPEAAGTMNAISVVLMYELFGLDNTETAVASNLKLSQIENIKQLDAYQQMKDTVVSSILEAETGSVRELFVSKARESANTLVDMASNAKGALRLMAANSVLDRAGHRPADVVEHRHKMDGGLHIHVIHKDESKQPPTIDLDL
jgi:hypothetical protein